jgi:hypothetical protein
MISAIEMNESDRITKSLVTSVAHQLPVAISNGSNRERSISLV